MNMISVDNLGGLEFTSLGYPYSYKIRKSIDYYIDMCVPSFCSFDEMNIYLNHGIWNPTRGNIYTIELLDGVYVASFPIKNFSDILENFDNGQWVLTERSLRRLKLNELKGRE